MPPAAGPPPPPNAVVIDDRPDPGAFSWATARRALDGLPGGGLNIAHETVDRHAAGPLAGKAALRFVTRDGRTTDLSYGALRPLTSRWANVLRSLGVGPQDRVFALAGRIPELYVCALGTLRNGSVFCPLFPALGPEPIRQRLALGDAKVLVTTEALFRRKVSGLLDRLPALEHVIVVGRTGGPATARVGDYATMMDGAADVCPVAPTRPEDMALLHFTSGTSGHPKGAVHVHDAVVAHAFTARAALDLRADDVFWCTADPGWVTGTSYGIVAPLACGVTTVVDEAEFDAQRWFEILESQAVTVWYTAPTALRLLMRNEDAVRGRFDLTKLRFVASVGERLDPEVVAWGERILCRPIHDTWWQTETGAIMIASPPTDVRAGSMGRPLPGIDAAILARGDDGRASVVNGRVAVVEGPGRDGELALRPGWPSMFRAYLHDDDRYRQCFADGWYLTGDIARRDADGYFWYVGRADDIISSAGHLIGPSEVESVMMQHPGVVEAAAIGVPDPVAGEVVEVFVTLRSGDLPSDDLRRELIAWGRQRLGPAIAPRDVAFDQYLPHTTSGKLIRRLLRARRVGAHAPEAEEEVR